MMHPISHSRNTLLLLFITLVSAGCSEEVSVSAPPTDVPITESTSAITVDSATETAIQSLLANYIIQIDSDFSGVNDSLATLHESITSLINTPDNDALAAAQNSWLDSYTNYELSALHRYFADTAVDENSALELFQLQYQLNQWPILPGYLDYVGDYPESGIVNDMTVALNSENLREQHGAFDVSEASVGFHVLEFMLWGENQTDGPRPIADFLPQLEPTPEQASDGMAVADLSNNRRRVFLITVADALTEDFASYMSVWSGGSAQLRLELSSLDGATLLLLTLDAMTAMLTEELLLKSLYPMLNGDFEQSLPSPYSKTSQNVASSHLSALEQLLLETPSDDERSLDEILTGFSTEYAEFFLQSFDASKECLVILYSDDLQAGTDTEFKVVECINLLTNMVDYFEQIKIALSSNA